MSDGIYEVDDIAYKKEEWISKNVEQFFDMVRNLVDETFVNEIAADLAYAYAEKSAGQPTHFYDAYDLTYAHAVCVLEYFYDCYKQEVDKEWQTYYESTYEE